jgi:hypothetical protein
MDSRVISMRINLISLMSLLTWPFGKKFFGLLRFAVLFCRPVKSVLPVHVVDLRRTGAVCRYFYIVKYTTKFQVSHS